MEVTLVCRIDVLSEELGVAPVALGFVDVELVVVACREERKQV